MNIKKKQFFRRILTGVLCSAVIITQAVPVFATDEYGAPLVTATPTPDPHTPYYKQPADTDSIKDWTKGPQIEGESAILVDMLSGTICLPEQFFTQKMQIRHSIQPALQRS